MLKFVSLHNHTGASIYDALGQPKDYAEWMLKNAGEDSGALAITDHGNLNNIGYLVSTQKDYDKKGAPVNMIYGVEAYYIPDLAEWRHLKNLQDEEKAQRKKKKKENNDESTDLVIENEEESKSKDYFDPVKRRNHLVVLATNQTGLENLFRLISRSYREGFYRKPRIDLKMLRDLNEGLVISSACIAGNPAYASFYARENNLDVMHTYDNELGPLIDIFGKDRFFLELQFNRIPEQQIVNLDMIQYAEKTGLKLIAAADAHYCKPDLWKDREIYKLLGWQMQKNEVQEKIKELETKTIQDLDCQLYLKNGDQMYDAYTDCFRKQFDVSEVKKIDRLVKEAIERTYDIAHNRIEKIYPNNEIKLPKTVYIKKENVETPFDHLKYLCLEGLKKKKLIDKKEYVERTIYELTVIKNLKLEEYFLATKQILDVLRKYMLAGTGRGSGVGSIVNYLLNITFIDPIKYGLIFERFISPSRAELPDIDNDLELKDEALEILKSHFGEENVLAISNYNRLQLKSLIKDLGRLYEIPFQETNAVTKVMEDEAKPFLLDEIGHDQKLYQFTYEGALKYSPTFQEFIRKYPHVGNHVKNLFQEKKSHSRHAGGVAIIPDAEKYLPIVRVRGVDQSPVSEGLTVQHLQSFFGIPKFDVLGLATLKIIRRCIENILKSQGIKNPSIDDVWDFYNENIHPDTVNDEDAKVFDKVYCAGRFPSVFQFAEKNVQKFCKAAKPRSVRDVSAITALYRPGSLASQGDLKYLAFDDSKNKKKFEQEHEIIKKILQETKGVIIYQEQMMQLAHELAGFSLEESNKLRKLLLKPVTTLADEIKKEREIAGKKFIQGCIENGLTEERARYLWEEEIMPSCSYSFNKCLHSSMSVETKNGKKLLSDVGVGELINSPNGFVRICKKYNNGRKKLYKVFTKSGKTLICTLDHKIQTKQGMKSLQEILDNNLEIFCK